MKAKELRIGNYVSRCDLFDNHSRVEQILEIARKIKTTGAVTVICTPSEIEPIPLTEEWLLRFGFENKYEDQEDNPIYKFESIEIVKTLFKDKYHLYAGFPSIEIKHVNQLQNLYFALTGEELTIKHE